MNEQVEQKANELLLNLIDKAQQGMEFAEAQIPDVVEQLLMWKFALSAIQASTSVLLVIGLLAFVISALRKNLCGDGAFISIMASVCVIPVAAALFSLDWLQIWLAPKVYLLEYAASLAK